ncbi:Rap1a/Tai family immunity protein [Neptunomonas antarctica]|uniref:Rap1a immunity protein domain-containing protein n=1 Tax=Neptunomonas antarctica TaxID=619304 RepID=A0A1N7ITP9_9GAMM|nr:Rap1a/Tai family immunity protein [Neptunomonas antarctica]SIS40462.1 hypothetical protein SAMN05421760_101118 [Neptunomonas antarctica]
MRKITHIVTIMACLFSPALLAENTPNNDLDSAYISGFLAGAQLTDSEIIKRFDSDIDNEEKSDFFKRAFKTRVGRTQAVVPATFYAGFCIPEDTSEKTVISAILKEVESTNGSEDLDKASTVYLTLRNLYPCE